MLEGPLDVEARAIGPGQPPGGRQVDGHPDAGGDEDGQAVHRLRVDQAPHRHEGEEGRHHQQGDPVAGGGEDLGPLEPERPGPSGRSGRQMQGPEGETEGAGVDQHVAGVGQQRQRVGRQGHHHLGDHEPHDQDHGGHQPPPVAGGREPVPMRIVARMIVVAMVAHPAQDSQARFLRGGARQDGRSATVIRDPASTDPASTDPASTDPIRALARSGLMALTGWPDGAPVLPPLGLPTALAELVAEIERRSRAAGRRCGSTGRPPSRVGRRCWASADRAASRPTGPAGCCEPATAGSASTCPVPTTWTCCPPSPGRPSPTRGRTWRRRRLPPPRSTFVAPGPAARPGRLAPSDQPGRPRTSGRNLGAGRRPPSGRAIPGGWSTCPRCGPAR